MEIEGQYDPTQPTQPDTTPVAEPNRFEQPATDVLVERQITQEELASTGFEVEEDQLTPQQMYVQHHPTPDHPTGRLP